MAPKSNKEAASIRAIDMKLWPIIPGPIRGGGRVPGELD
jgi:hypothetical protein